MRWMEAEVKEVAAEWHLEAAVVEVADLTTTGRHFLTNKAVLRVLRDHERVPDH